MFCYRKRKKSS